MKVRCECDSTECDLLVDVEATPETYSQIIEDKLVVISNSCEHGPEKTDEKVEDKGTYTLYREKS